MSKALDPFRVYLRDSGEVNWETIPDTELKERIAVDIRDGTLSLDEHMALCSKRDAWMESSQKQRTAAAIKSMSPERKNELRKMLGDAPAADAGDDFEAVAAEMERKLAAKYGLPFTGRDSEDLNAVHARLTKNLHSGDIDMSAGQELMDMARRDAGEGDGIRIKSISERYGTDRKIGKHRKAHVDAAYDRPILFAGEEVREPSELQCALAGVWFKRLAIKSGVNHVLSDHDQQLLQHLYEKSEFIIDDHEKSQVIKGTRVKSLLDDSTSGGQNAVPTWFDEIAVTEPLLFSELYSRVNVREVSKGSSFRATSVANVTLTEGAGAAEGTALTEFNTADMIAPIDGDFHVVAVALTLGLDFMEDTAIDVGMTVKEVIGDRFANRFDYYIAKGNGSTMPLGIMNTSGVNNFTPTTPTTGPVVLADILEAYFAVGPEYRKRAGSRFNYGMNDTLYARARAIATGVTGDSRLALGMDLGSYSFWEGQGRTNVAIQQDMSNDEMFTADLSRYRFYRRKGMTLKVETGGSTLTRSNLALFYARARVGGKLVNAEAAAVATGFQT